MANHASSKKRIRRNKKREIINGARRGRVRTYIKKVELALEAGDTAGAEEAFKVARPEMQRSVAKGIFHKNNVSRKISRLSKRIKDAKAAA